MWALHNFSIFKLCLSRLHPNCTCVKLIMHLGVLHVVECVVRIVAYLVKVEPNMQLS